MRRTPPAGRKTGRGFHIYQNYRGLNNVIKNRYPLPLVRETLDAICICQKPEDCPARADVDDDRLKNR
jgi:hypothetical protein